MRIEFSSSIITACCKSKLLEIVCEKGKGGGHRKSDTRIPRFICDTSPFLFDTLEPIVGIKRKIPISSHDHFELSIYRNQYTFSATALDDAPTTQIIITKQEPIYAQHYRLWGEPYGVLSILYN